MDQKLKDQLDEWYKLVEVLSQKERVYFELEGNEKVLYSKLFLNAEGKTVADKEAEVYSSEDWIDFQVGKNIAKVDFLKHKRFLDVTQASYQAEYLQCKQDYDSIRKPGCDITGYLFRVDEPDPFNLEGFRSISHHQGVGLLGIIPNTFPNIFPCFKLRPCII